MVLSTCTSSSWSINDDGTPDGDDGQPMIPLPNVCRARAYLQLGGQSLPVFLGLAENLEVARSGKRS